MPRKITLTNGEEPRLRAGDDPYETPHGQMGTPVQTRSTILQRAALRNQKRRMIGPSSGASNRRIIPKRNGATGTSIMTLNDQPDYKADEKSRRIKHETR